MNVPFRAARARDGNWTHDPTLTKGVLYQLSYAGVGGQASCPHWWAVKDSNLRRRLPTDLQSVPFGHLGNRPFTPSPAGDRSAVGGDPMHRRYTGPVARLPRCSTEFQIAFLKQAQADDGNRTRNLPLTRRLLCRLSYVGVVKNAPDWASRLYQRGDGLTR